MFNAKQVKNDLVQWIRDWFKENGPGCNAVIGISGGKDSTVIFGLVSARTLGLRLRSTVCTRRICLR